MLGSPGIRPNAPAQVVCESVQVFAAVAPQTGEMTALVLPVADTEMMNLFLEHVSQTFARYFVVMQVDQAAWHHSTTLRLPDTIRLIQQPAYSPEVNPVEHIWEEVCEKYLHNRLFPSLDALVEVLSLALNALTDDKERLCSLTGFPHLKMVA
jgi:hypothetical protein